MLSTSFPIYEASTSHHRRPVLPLGGQDLEETRIRMPCPQGKIAHFHRKNGHNMPPQRHAVYFTLQAHMTKGFSACLSHHRSRALSNAVQKQKITRLSAPHNKKQSALYNWPHSQMSCTNNWTLQWLGYYSQVCMPYEQNKAQQLFEVCHAMKKCALHLHKHKLRQVCCDGHCRSDFCQQVHWFSRNSLSLHRTNEIN